MVRRHDEPVRVRAAAPGGAAAPVGAAPAGVVGRQDAPRSFVWRGRRYTVCAVLDAWQERRAWWRGVGEDAAPGDTERRVWRVEARPPAGPVGVFDLGRDDDHWLLLRAHD